MIVQTGLGDRWGYDNMDDYARAIDSIAPGASAAIQQRAEMTGMDLIQAGLQVVNTLVLADSQRRLLRAQLQRAEQGLPPLDATQYGVGASVNVGISSDTQRMLMIGGAALLAVLLIGPMLRGRR